MAKASEYRRVFEDLLPFVLYRRRKFWFYAVNGKRVKGVAALDAKNTGKHRSLRVCTRQCCVHHLCENVIHEGLHGMDVYEWQLDKDPDLSWREMGPTSPAREAAYALLSSLLHIPPYCAKIDRKGG